MIECTIDRLVGEKVNIVTYSTADHVQNGLLAIWDGIENAGTNTHSSNVANDGWVDLINGITLNINPVNNPTETTSGVFTSSNAVTFRSRNMRVNATENSKVLNVLNAVKSGFYTEQVVGQRYTLVNSCFMIATQLVNTGDTSRRAIHYYDTYNNANAFNMCNTSNVYLNMGNWPNGFDGSPCSFSFMRTLTNGYIYRNGSLWKSGSKQCQAASTATQGSIILGSSNYSASSVTGSTTATSQNDIPVHCIRIYSRNLSADEIAANHAIDVQRFQLPN